MKTKRYSAFAIQYSRFMALGAGLALWMILFVAVPLAPAQTNWGNALEFDGKDDYVSVPSGTWFSGDFTVEAWVYERSYNYWSRVIDFGNGPDADNVLFALSAGYGGRPALHLVRTGEGTTTLTAPEAIPLYQWVHLAATLKGGTGTLYVDGVPVISGQLKLPKPVTRTKNYIGKSNWNVDEYANARFDDLRIWNVARTAEQIREGMGHPLTGAEPNLVGYWKFDEAAGTSVLDATVNRKNGILFGGPLRLDSPLPFFTRINDSLPKVGSGSCVRWGDFNNDGQLDILLMGQDAPDPPIAQVWQNQGGGTFMNIDAGLTGGYMASADWGDYNNDGFLDVLIAGYAPASSPISFAQVWRDHGNRTFTDISAGLPGVHSTVAWGDFDNDGRLDILLTGATVSGPIAQVWRNHGDGTFTDIHAGLTGVAGSASAWGDYDNDGLLDILLAGYAGGNTGTNIVTQLWRNNGDGTFTDIHAGLTGVYDGSASWGDYDHDGRLDILLTGWDNRSHFYTQVWRNNGDGTFSDIRAGLPGTYMGSAVWGDYDNDGRLDILLTGSTSMGSIAQVWRNTVTGFVMSELIGINQGSAVWGDYDNDGRLDILLAGNGPSNRRITQVWRNIYPVTNTPPTAPSNLTATPSGREIIMSWNSATDAQTPAASLSYNLRVGTAPGRADIVAPQADPLTGRRRVPKLGNAQLGLTALLANLPEGEYYWSVQTVDGAFAASPFAPEARFGVYKPVVATLSATNVGAAGAILHGTVNPRERETFAWFEYGLTMKYGSTTPPVNVGHGTNSVEITESVTGLLPWMTYHCRAVGSNGVGRVEGPNLTFVLPGPSASAPALSPLSNITLPQGGSTSVEFSVSDADTPLDQLAVRAYCNNPVLLPNLSVGGSGGTRILTLTPAANHSGSATLTVNVSDDTSTASRAFNLTVTPRPDSSPLMLTNARTVSGEAWQFRVVDAGSGSGSYVVQYRPDLSPTNGWILATNVSPMAGGVFQVDSGPSQPGTGFYRIKGILMPAVHLGASDFSVEEGAGLVGPVILFNGPYVGMVRYTWTGSEGTTNGTVQVNGSTAVIPVQFTDNTTIDPMRHLTLRLEPGTDYALTGITEVSVTIDENDADWQGTLVIPNGLADNTAASLTNRSGSGYRTVSLPQSTSSIIGFTLRMQQSNGSFQGRIQSDGFGFFPANALAQLTRTANRFSAVATNMPLPALTNSPLFSAPHRLDLRLDATNAPGQTNVAATRIGGVVTLVNGVPGRPYLDSAISGTFLLRKPPGIPSTNEMLLHPAP